MVKAAKFRMHRNHQVRLSQSGEFTVDGVAGKWSTLAEAQKAIEAQIVKDVAEPALYDSEQAHQGVLPDLVPVTFLGFDVDGRPRVKDAEGKITTEARGEVFPDTEAVRVYWRHIQRLELAEHLASERKYELRERLDKLALRLPSAE